MSIARLLARPELLALAPYRAAHWEPGFVRLHANENPWRAVGDTSAEGLAQYPQPIPEAVRARLADLYQLPASHVLPTRGADEGIDLLARAFLAAGRDAALICPPTFGMYAVATRIQGADVVEVPLRSEADFALDTPAVLSALADTRIKLLFLCAPGNPTATDLAEEDVLAVLRATRDRALVVLDEAYVEFADRPSWSTRLAEFRNLVVLRTLSKAYSLAGARVGAVLADPSVIDLLERILPPYSMSTGTIESVLRALDPRAIPIARGRIARLIEERATFADCLRALPSVLSVGTSATNFLYVTVRDPAEFERRASAGGFLLRNFSSGSLTPGALRISLGDHATCMQLLEALQTP